MREQSTTRQLRGTQGKGHTHETTVLMEGELNRTVCGERLSVRMCKHDTHTKTHTVEIRKKNCPVTLPKLDLNVTRQQHDSQVYKNANRGRLKYVTHSVTANDIPLCEGFSKLFLLPTGHFFTPPIVSKREFVFTWYKTDKKPEGEKKKRILTGITTNSRKGASV